MKPETADYLARARECLDAAKTINAFPLPQVAAKEAYLTAYHAASAFVFESTGKVVKSHSGMRTMFALAAKGDPRVDRALASLLGRAYKFKEVADYGVGSQAVVTVKEAQDGIDIAQRFVDTIAPITAAGREPATRTKRATVAERLRRTRSARSCIILADRVETFPQRIPARRRVR